MCNVHYTICTTMHTNNAYFFARQLHSIYVYTYLYPTTHEFFIKKIQNKAGGYDDDDGGIRSQLILCVKIYLKKKYVLPKGMTTMLM